MSAPTLNESDAVNLARNIVEHQYAPFCSETGVMALSLAVLAMDKHICDLEAKIIRQTSVAIREGNK